MQLIAVREDAMEGNNKCLGQAAGGQIPSDRHRKTEWGEDTGEEGAGL